MKIYNPNTYTKLGFDTILKDIHRKAVSEDAKNKCLEIAPISDSSLILKELESVREFKDLLDFDDSFPFTTFSSVGYLLEKARIEGNWLNIEELNRLYQWLKVVRNVRTFILKRKEKYPRLTELVGDQPFTEGILFYIERTLDENGNLRDNASPELASIRKNMKDIAVELRTVLNRILRMANENNWSVEKEITMRNDRLVIPIKADAKGRIPGFIHDISKSGETVFIEPTASLMLNNQLRELQISETNEITRILVDITGKIGSHADILEGFREVITEIDVLRAKALLAQEMKANMPIFTPEGTKTFIREGRFPVLLMKALHNPFEVVPLNLTLDKKGRILLISGPNAGGKSVSLKTVGLLQVMLQAGFLIPVHEKSEFRVFDALFIDLGDEQSVENDLSTYTSHLAQMRQMGDNLNSNSLFLIDEFGGGTDPKLGGAIAEAFLERFIRQNAYGIITTHYGNLKEYAHSHEGVGNAAMEFNTELLKPTYRLLMGIPGRSYAFEIAERVGVHGTIIRKAKGKIGKEQVNSEALISDLEKKNSVLANLLEQNEKKAEELANLKEKYELLRIDLRSNKQQILNDAKSEAKKIILEANKLIEKTIRDIKESKADKDLTKQIRKDLDDSLEKYVLEEVEISPKNKQKTADNGIVILPNEIPVAGDWVKLKNAESYGKLVELDGERAVIEIGELRTNAKLKQLVKIEPPVEEVKSRPKTKVMKIADIKSVATKIDVMGMRVEEALPLIDKRIDDAVWAGLSFFSILHGKGTGTLRDMIRKHLRDLPMVASLTDGSAETGGDGWTIVGLRS